jgi:cobalt-zinc-cadmium efflux system outer membrane protein
MAPLARPAALALMLLGMACVPRNAGYEDVRTMVSRTGHDVRWQHLDSANLTQEARAILAAPLTEKSAVRLALLQNRELQATFEQLGIARGDLVRALRLPNPSAEAGLKYAHAGSPGMEVSLSQDLAELILLPMRSGAAHAEFAAARVEVAGRITDLIFEVRKAFLGYLAEGSASGVLVGCNGACHLPGAAQCAAGPDRQ